VIRWSAHLHLLFTEWPLAERFQAAAEAGFTRVETWSAFELPRAQLIDAVERAGVRLGGFNLDSGDMPNGDRGFLNLPGRRDAVLANVEEALELAERLDTPVINALAGNRVGDDHAAELAVIEERVRELASLARGTGTTFVIEPLNPHDNPRYVLSCLDDAVALVERVADPHVGLLFDVFQIARMGLDPVAEIERTHGLIRHVQVADVPGRHAPGTGTIDYAAVFAKLENLSYDGSVGLEYRPRAGEDTVGSLGWLPVAERTAGSATYPLARVAS
jgi:hydroxypyruvate isomerase